MRNRVRVLLGLAVAVLLVSGTPMLADEGFWVFNAVPRNAIKRPTGWT